VIQVIGDVSASQNPTSLLMGTRGFSASFNTNQVIPKTIASKILATLTLTSDNQTLNQQEKYL